MASTNYLGQPNLKNVGQNIEWTKETLHEYMRCKEDPEYFILNYVQIVHVDKGLVPFNMYDYQKDMIQKFTDNRFVICKMPRQTGKCFNINTNIRVRNKKTGEMLELTVGELYDKIEAKKTNKDV